MSHRLNVPRGGAPVHVRMNRRAGLWYILEVLITMMINSKITTEDDTLFYRVLGHGTPILFVPGGGGNGDLFLPLAKRLSDRYKLITYDRRANAGSTMNHPNVFSVSQQARDAVAVLTAAGEQSAFVFGNSSGAIIALEMLRLFPERVRGVIAHEPPIARLHPDSKKWRNFFRSCHRMSFGIGGASAAATRFLMGIEVPALQMIKAQLTAEKYLKQELKLQKKERIPSRKASKYLIQQELLPITEYKPDINILTERKEKVLLAVGSYAKEHNTFVFQIARQLSEQIHRPYVIVPGHHGSFMDEPERWAMRMEELICRLET